MGNVGRQGTNTHLDALDQERHGEPSDAVNALMRPADLRELTVWVTWLSGSARQSSAVEVVVADGAIRAQLGVFMGRAEPRADQVPEGALLQVVHRAVPTL